MEREVGRPLGERFADRQRVHGEVVRAEVAENEPVESEQTPGDDPWGDEPTQAMPVVGLDPDEGGDRDEENFRFSFDDDRP